MHVHTAKVTLSLSLAHTRGHSVGHPEAAMLPCYGIIKIKNNLNMMLSVSTNHHMYGAYAPKAARVAALQLQLQLP